MKKHSKRRLLLNFILTFFGFFILSGSVVTVSFLLYFKLADMTDINIHTISPILFLNLLLVSTVFGLFGTLWRIHTVEKPVEEINDALMKIKNGKLDSKLKRRSFYSRYSAIVRNINVIASELSSIDNLKVSLMSNISHELKTPMSVINNYAALLQTENLPDEKRIEYAKNIIDSSSKVTELITNILKLNQLENQKIPSNTSEYNLSEQLCECLLDFENIWEKKNIDIITDIDDDVMVISDRQLMSIVWNNILSNAFKFTPENGQVTVSLTSGKKYAVVKISDTGCGIPEGQTDLIFDKFYQCDSSRSTDGNGLGLALVKRIINLTESIIKVESEEGKGTTFTVKIHKN